MSKNKFTIEFSFDLDECNTYSDCLTVIKLNNKQIGYVSKIDLSQTTGEYIPNIHFVFPSAENKVENNDIKAAMLEIKKIMPHALISSIKSL